MSPDRRYSDDEIAAIFREAAEAQKAAQHRSSNAEGLTLAELQAIGLDAGITPEFIQHAADAMDRTEVPLQPRMMLGQPIGVSRTVDLPGTMSDDEWARLVVEIRSTFRAPGSVKRDGTLREWSNGNLKVLLEPTEEGQRLNMSTRKGSASGALVSGLIYFVIGVAMLLAALVGSDSGVSIPIMSLVFTAVGAGLYGYNALTLPKWAEERNRQMEHIGAKAVGLAKARQGEPSAADQQPAIEAPAGPQATIELDEEQPRETAGRRQKRTR